MASELLVDLCQRLTYPWLPLSLMVQPLDVLGRGKVLAEEGFLAGGALYYTQYDAIW